MHNIYVSHSYLFHQRLGQQVLNKPSQVLPHYSLVEEGHSAVHQPNDGGRTVSSQLVGQTTLITEVHNANAHTWCNRRNRLLLYSIRKGKTQALM